MKYLTTFEKFGDWFRKKLNPTEETTDVEFPTGKYCTYKDLPDVGYYVILNTKYDEQHGFSHPDKFKDLIGVISENTKIWNPDHTGILVTIFYDQLNEEEDTYTQELECWSKNKKEIERYLDSKNYNL